MIYRVTKWMTAKQRKAARMNILRKVSLGIASGLTTTLLIASGNVVADNDCIQPCYDNGFSILLGSGASFSKQGHIKADPIFWDPAVQGYNAKLGKTELFSASLGYQFDELLNGTLEATHRPSYKYHKFQIPSTNNSPGQLGNKTRHFNLSNTTVMGNIILDGSAAGLYVEVTPCTVIQPILGAGLGASYNYLSNLHTVTFTTESGFNDVASIVNPRMTTSFAWQVMAGLELMLDEKFGLNFGYRYFDGGRFSSNDYLTTIPTGFNNPISVPSWKGRLEAHEVFLNFKVKI